MLPARAPVCAMIAAPSTSAQAWVIAVARSRDYRRLSLETGAHDAFKPAQALYRTVGFTYCGPFADYAPDPNSVFMTLELPAATASEAPLSADTRT